MEVTVVEVLVESLLIVLLDNQEGGLLLEEAVREHGDLGGDLREIFEEFTFNAGNALECRVAAEELHEEAGCLVDLELLGVGELDDPVEDGGLDVLGWVNVGDWFWDIQVNEELFGVAQNRPNLEVVLEIRASVVLVEEDVLLDGGVRLEERFLVREDLEDLLGLGFDVLRVEAD